MSEWAQSRYEGETFQGWNHGKGKYFYSNGVIYEGQFYKGQFHGEGVLIYPNGGQYKGEWDHGKLQKGEYFFHDGLKYEKKDWQYCQEDDRRFYQETLNGIKPAGATQMSREDKDPYDIPQGTYDVGEGYYEPIKSIIYTYNGEIKRTPSQNEVEEIVRKCRYNPRKDMIIDGQDDKIISKVTEMAPKQPLI